MTLFGKADLPAAASFMPPGPSKMSPLQQARINLDKAQALHFAHALHAARKPAPLAHKPLRAVQAPLGRPKAPVAQRPPAEDEKTVRKVDGARRQPGDEQDEAAKLLQMLETQAKAKTAPAQQPQAAPVVPQEAPEEQTVEARLEQAEKAAAARAQTDEKAVNPQQLQQPPQAQQPEPAQRQQAQQADQPGQAQQAPQAPQAQQPPQAQQASQQAEQAEQAAQQVEQAEQAAQQAEQAEQAQQAEQAEQAQPPEQPQAGQPQLPSHTEKATKAIAQQGTAKPAEAAKAAPQRAKTEKKADADPNPLASLLALASSSTMGPLALQAEADASKEEAPIAGIAQDPDPDQGQAVPEPADEAFENLMIRQDHVAGAPLARSPGSGPGGSPPTAGNLPGTFDGSITQLEVTDGHKAGSLASQGPGHNLPSLSLDDLKVSRSEDAGTAAAQPAAPSAGATDPLAAPAAAQATGGPRAETASAQTEQPFRSALAEHIENATRGANPSIKLILHPEALGAVHVRVSLVGGGVRAVLRVEHEDVRTALAGQMEALRQSLADQGIKVDRLEVNVSGGGSQNQDQAMAFAQQQSGQGRQPQQREAAPFFAGRGYAAASGLEPQTEPALPASPSSGLDIRA